METETYKNAKLILERFDPDSKKKLVRTLFLSLQINIYRPIYGGLMFLFSLKELEAQPIGPPATPRQGQGEQTNPFSLKSMALLRFTVRIMLFSAQSCVRGLCPLVPLDVHLLFL